MGGDTLRTGFSKGNSGDNETMIAIRLSPASNCTWYSTSSLSSTTLKIYNKESRIINSSLCEQQSRLQPIS